MRMKRLLFGAGIALPLVFAVFMFVVTRNARPEPEKTPTATNDHSAPVLAGDAEEPVSFELAWKTLQHEEAGHRAAPAPGQENAVRVPVLCYHRIDNVRGDFYHTPREMFEWQMQWLSQNADVIPSSQLVAWVRYRQGLSTTKVTLPPRPVVIHFDDNYRSVYEIAWPILKRYKLPWSFFVYKHHHQPIAEKHLREMAASGVDIQAHSMTHPWFHKPARGQSMHDYVREMHWQVGGSKKYLEGISERKVHQFAWPFGSYSDLSILLAFQYGFDGMFVADGGYVTATSSLTSLERVLVTKGWSKEYFKTIVTGKAKLAKVFKPAWLVRNKEEARRLTAPKKEYL